MISWVENLIQIIYPNLCLVCSDPLVSGEKDVCNICQSNLPYTNYHLQSGNLMEQRFWGKVEIERATALFFYQKETSTQKLLELLKYKGEQGVGELLGRLLGVSLLQSTDFKDIDMLVPVPLHPNKLKKRGYNQSEVICRGIGFILQKPLNTSCLYRAIENPTQTKKGVYERWENAAGIFAVKDEACFAEKHILLVDDVLTTGSTVEACVQAVKQACDTRVSIATLAIA